MKYSRILVLAFLILIFSFSTSLYADVPQMVNYQGKLTTPAGALVDTTIQMVFTIYDAAFDGGVLWTETQPAVVVEKGIYSVLLGSVNSIPDTAFDGSVRYLGVQVGGDPEMTPRKEIVSVPYAYRAATVQAGGIDCSDCDDRFVNVQGPDSVVATGSGAAFLARAVGDWSTAVYGYAKGGGGGHGYGGYFVADTGGTGNNIGVRAYAGGTGADTWGSTSFGENYSTGWVIGSYAYAKSHSTGSAFGGKFFTYSSGTGEHYGVYGAGYGESSASTYGSYGYAENTSTGDVYGGYFAADTAGTGTHYGVYGEGYGESSASTYGSYGYAENTSTGMPYGGYFSAENNSSAMATGAFGVGRNSSSGSAYGGYFLSMPQGTGRHYGVRGDAWGSSSSGTRGVTGFAENTSDGWAIGGEFWTSDEGTGEHFGVMAWAHAAPAAAAYGTYGSADGTSTGPAYGAYGSAGGTSTGPAYGAYGQAYNTSTGTVYGGYFRAVAVGTGTKYGVYGTAPTSDGYAGYFAGDVRITDSLIVIGGKSAAVKVDNGEYRLLYSMESPESWFEDFGEGSLANGKTTVEIDPLFAQTINTSAKYHVFLTPLDQPVTLAVANKTSQSFEVIGPADANISFSYRIVARRKGFEGIRLAKMGGPTPEEVAAQEAKHQAEIELERARTEQHKQQMEQESSQTEMKLQEQRAEMQQERESRQEKRAEMEQRREEMEREREKMKQETGLR